MAQQEAIPRRSVESPVVPDADGLYHLSPTDIAQYIGHHQCERYLRLRLHGRTHDRGGGDVFKEYGVSPQALPPLLTRSGAAFEEFIQQTIVAHYPMHDYRPKEGAGGHRLADNDDVVRRACELGVDETLVLFQPRLVVRLGRWLVRGDVDILRLHRGQNGMLVPLIADMKSSKAARVEHRLQVAFYHEMLDALFREKQVPRAEIGLGILYRGPLHEDETISDDDVAKREEQYAACERLFGARAALFEEVPDVEPLRAEIQNLVTGNDSLADRIAHMPFDAIPFHLEPKCDSCLYNEFCMKRSAQRDDLSLIPHLTHQDKLALHRAGIRTTSELASLKEVRERAERPTTEATQAELLPTELVPVLGKEDLVRSLGATWPVGPRLDELIQRARRYRQSQRDRFALAGQDDLGMTLSNLKKGYGSLPYVAPDHNPNLVRVYIDVQRDYLQDRLYLLGAKVVACEGGRDVRDEHIVHMTDGPPDNKREERLFVSWIDAVIRSIIGLAAPDENGEPHAPVHLIFYTDEAQKLLLDGLGRHATRVLGATPLYDFMTQLAAFDSPVATILEREIRDHKNYPIVAQSLQSVASFLRFAWDRETPFRTVFHTRLFDFWRKLQDSERVPEMTPYYIGRARFNSAIPLEYAYNAWHDLDTEARAAHGLDATDDPPAPEPGDYTPYEGATIDRLVSFQKRRLDAMEHITHDFKGNERTQKRPFYLPDLGHFVDRAQTMAQALVEFVTIERHVGLNEWKSARLVPPERRVLSGITFLARYHESDQSGDVVARNRENLERYRRRQEYEEMAGEEGLSKQQRDESRWSHEGMRIRLRLETDGVDCTLDEMLSLTELEESDRVVIFPRISIDSRLPVAQRTEFTSTSKQLLYAQRADIERFEIERDENGRARRAYVHMRMAMYRPPGDSKGFIFSMRERPFVDGGLYTLDEDPNDWPAFYSLATARALCEGKPNTLYERMSNTAPGGVDWPAAAADGQRHFYQGLEALAAAGAFHTFEESKQEYIGEYGDAPILLVQGPPGTGKSYATAFAVFARMQGAMTAGKEYRVAVSCRNHSATDVVLDAIVELQEQLRAWASAHPTIAATYFDSRLYDVPLFRLRPKSSSRDGIISLPADREREGEKRAMDRVMAERWCVMAGTPSAIRNALKDRWSKEIYGRNVCGLLVLDEASQMNLPEGMTAAIPLATDGQIIVVGDHRQMPPIIAHDWNREPRRTFKEFHTYESLFLTLLSMRTPVIRFAESFRLHREMAEFLRREIYQKDGIAYHSRRDETLTPFSHDDPFIEGVLSPEHPLVVVVHDEMGSQTRNPFEQGLVAPILEALANTETYGFGPDEGLGVVVPHRAQKAALRDAIPALTRLDPVTGVVTRSAVDTVERFQGAERSVILVSATESDRSYVLMNNKFLLDPRRLTVALSRSKRKMILVASRSIFTLFSADEEMFANAQLWKNLLRHTCTVNLWEGERDGHRVWVWGNRVDG